MMKVRATDTFEVYSKVPKEIASANLTIIGSIKCPDSFSMSIWQRLTTQQSVGKEWA